MNNKKILTFIIVIFIFFLGIFIGNPYNEEVIDMSNFSDYYEDNIDENGGWSVEKDSYTTFKTLNLFDNGKIVLTSKFQINAIPEKKIYIIKNGDTLSEIAMKHGITVGVLRFNNPGITEKKLKIGGKITVVNVNGIFYKIKKGDSLNKIAKVFGVDIEQLKKINKIQDDNIIVGNTIFIKDPKLREYLKNQREDVVSSGVFGFTMPIKYTGVSSPQGPRFHPVLKRYIYHSGVDLRAKYIPVYASKSGRVSFAGLMRGYGKIIIIQHDNGFETRYAHLDKIGVSVGRYVETGDLIGKSGKTGRVTGPHLHFELRQKGKILNPMKYIPIPKK